ncbi:MAG: hypothetical protein L7U52_05845 [Alphaproteobacteria bacterium]|nr:hypothetical protein [Alphaproteobacteria bacterium]
MVALAGYSVSVKRITQILLLCAGALLVGCTPQIPPVTQEITTLPQPEKRLPVSNDAISDGDDTSLLATETIDPEADETSVTIIVPTPQPSDQTVASSSEQYLYPDSFIGIPVSEVQKKIGAADFIRQEGSVVTWQYSMPSCVIDFFILFATTEISSMYNLPTDKIIDSHFTRSRIHNQTLNETQCLTEFTIRRQPH